MAVSLHSLVRQSSRSRGQWNLGYTYMQVTNTHTHTGGGGSRPEEWEDFLHVENGLAHTVDKPIENLVGEGQSLSSRPIFFVL